MMSFDTQRQERGDFVKGALAWMKGCIDPLVAGTRSMWCGDRCNLDAYYLQATGNG